MFRRGLLTLVALVVLQQSSADFDRGNFRSRSLESENAEQRFNDFQEEHAEHGLDVESESDSWNPLSGALKLFNDFAGGDSNDAEEEDDLNLSTTGTFQDFEDAELPGPGARKSPHRRLQKVKAPQVPKNNKQQNKINKINNKIAKQQNKINKLIAKLKRIPQN